MFGKYTNIKFTALLLVFLGIPFTIKTLNAKLEIFPAPIFPSGSSKFQVDEKPEVYYNVLYGLDSVSKVKKELDKYIFFKKIPVHYLNFLANKNFGLSEDPKATVISFLGHSITKENKVEPHEVENSKGWARKLLIEQGCNDSVLYIQRRLISIDKISRKTNNLTVQDEAAIGLY